MQAIFQLIGHIAKWAVSNPQNMQTATKIMYVTQKTYQQLSPENKEKVDALIRKGAIKLAKLAIGDACNWLENEAVNLGFSDAATKIAKEGLQRAADIGIDKAIEELHDS